MDIETTRKALWDAMMVASSNIPAPHTASGITPDSVKFSPEYRAAKAVYAKAMKALQDFNSKHKRIK